MKSINDSLFDDSTIQDTTHQFFGGRETQTTYGTAQHNAPSDTGRDYLRDGDSGGGGGQHEPVNDGW